MDIVIGALDAAFGKGLLTCVGRGAAGELI
jgi:hypothetical protein